MTVASAAYIFAMLVLGVLIFATLLQIEKQNHSNTSFLWLAIMGEVFLVVSMVAEIIDGKPEYRLLSYVVNVLSFLMVDVVVIAFSSYLSSITGGTSNKWKWVMNPGVFFCYLRLIMIIVLECFELIFVIDDSGHYVGQSFEWLAYLGAIVVVIMIMIVTINKRHCFSRQNFVVILFYLLFPMAASFLELFTGLYFFTGASMVVSILLVFVLIQSSVIETGKVREKVLEELSSTDQLTGLNNRRALYERFDKIKPEQSFGVLFCDINGLKEVNDSKGHTEGDRLIIRFANLVMESFGIEDSFRISGDEFVVLISAISEEDFVRAKELFKQKIKSEGSIAAVGFSFGSGNSIEQLVSEAEASMYVDKRGQYQRGEANPRRCSFVDAGDIQ